MKSQKKFQLHANTEIPLFPAMLKLVVADGVEPARALFNKEFGVCCHEDYSALTTYSGKRFGLFFKSDRLEHDYIAHEVFHVTHRILERVGVVFTAENHEPFSYLCGWITKWVYAEIAAKGLKVK